MSFNIGDIVKFKKISDWEHVTRLNSHKLLFPTKDSYATISYSRRSSDGTWYVRLEGCALEEFFAQRFELVKEGTVINPKYRNVINKIKQMELKRKANGYAF